MNTKEIQDLMNAVIEFGKKGWLAATSGNFSKKISENKICITVSGSDKSAITENDFMEIDSSGKVLTSGKASAETLLHLTIYKNIKDAGCVMHVHSVYATVLSKLFATHGILTVNDYEMLKAFGGIDSHFVTYHIPIFSNSQDMQALSARLEQTLLENKNYCGFLLSGHGLYSWGPDVKTTKRYVEAFEFIFECEYRRLMLL